MTTTAPSNPHPPASQAAHGQPPSHAARAAHGPQQPTDLFSSLLALLSPDAAPLDPLGTATATAAGALGEDPLAEDPADSDNPLAALMAWTAPHELAPAPLAGDGSLAGETRGLDTRADRLGGVPAEGLPLANGSAPGRQVAAPWQPAAARASAPGAATALATAAGQPAGGADTPALRWSRAAPPTESGASAAWPVRSTVALDARFQATSPTATPTGALAALAGRAGDGDEPALPGASPTGGARATGEAAAGPTATTGATAADSGLGGDATADGGHARHEAGTDPNSAQDPYAAPADAEAVEVQHWGAGAMRHASLRVGEDAQNAIDIQLAVRGDEVRLDFRTDDAAARGLLREHAQTALGDLLQQGGLTLGQVSVGDQGQGDARRDGPTPPAPAPRAERADAGPAEAAPPRPAAPGANGPGLDLFI